MLDKNESFRVDPEIVLRKEEDGAFLFEPDTGRICYLNEMGITIWMLCEKPITQEQITHRICAEYPEVPQERIEEDALAFLKELDRLGFISADTKA